MQDVVFANAMARLLEQFPDTEAVICVSDLSAFGALTECQRRGLRVPEDISIGGFGAYEIGSICVPTLTTIDAHARDIGRKTGSLLLDILDGRQDVLIEPQLIVRESTR